MKFKLFFVCLCLTTLMDAQTFYADVFNCDVNAEHYYKCTGELHTIKYSNGILTIDNKKFKCQVTHKPDSGIFQWEYHTKYYRYFFFDDLFRGLILIREAQSGKYQDFFYKVNSVE